MQPVRFHSQGSVVGKFFFVALFAALPSWVSAQWVAINDEGKGPASNPNVTSYAPGGLGGALTNGPLTNLATGAGLPVTLKITSLVRGIAAATTMGVPVPGTPAYDTFNAYVDWNTSANGTNGTHIYLTNTINYLFSGLNPTKVYNFTGTAVRQGTPPGNPPYSNRWTRVELLGALSYSNHHSGGVLTSNQSWTALISNQCAFNSGLNVTNLAGTPTGDVVEWTNIAPALAGTFTVQVRRYTNHISLVDYATNEPGYALAQIRLAEVGWGVTNLTLTLNAPTNGANFSPCTVVTSTVTITGPPTNVSYYLDNAPVTNRYVTPFSPVNFGPLGLGSHSIYAVAQSGPGVNFYSGTNTFTISENQAPTIAITNIYAQGLTNGPGKAFLVGTCITNQLLVMDPDGSVTNVDWYENGVLKERTGTTNNFYVILMNDAPSRTNVFTAVAWDNCGVSVTSAPVSVVVTNASNVFVLVPNRSIWKYYSSNSPPPFDSLGHYWYQANFDDSTWTNSGPGFFGYGTKPGEELPANYTTYPEGTTLYIGPVGSRYRTIYFRKTFNVGSPSGYTNLIVKLQRDDGAVVWLNGTPVMTNGITVTNDLTAGTNDFQFSTNLAVNCADNGTLYYSITNPISNLLFAGNNVLAVEVHQSGTGSHDLIFDLMLWAQGVEGPKLTIVNNNNGTATISWAPASGILQESSDLRNWNDSSGQNNPATWLISGNRFFRVR